MTKPRRPCIEPGCPSITPPGGTRCPSHQQGKDAERNAARPWYKDPAYIEARKGLAATPLARCHLCGEYARVDDPMTLDHVLPASTHGGQGPWLPAHRSCNSSRGARPLGGGDDLDA